MGFNKNLKSRNKIVQPLDFFGNDILNVSQIVGNNYSNRTRDLEISTRDLEGSQSIEEGSGNISAGHLILRAGIKRNPEDQQVISSNSGYVHITAGQAKESGNSTLENFGIIVRPSRKIDIESDKLDILARDLLFRSQEDLDQVDASFRLTTVEGPNDNPIDDSTLRINTLNINKALNFGKKATGNIVDSGIDTIPVKGYASNLYLDVDQAALIQSSKTGSNLKFGFPVKKGSDEAESSLANEQALFEIDHSSITNRAYINNLDIYGNIRIGSVETTTIKVDSNNESLIFTDYPKNTNAPSESSNQKIEIYSGSIDLDTTSSLKIGEKDSSEVKVKTKKITITGTNSGYTESTSDENYSPNLIIESQSSEGSNLGFSTEGAESFIKVDVLDVESDLYSNAIHFYWDDNTKSLVFAKVK